MTLKEWAAVIIARKRLANKPETAESLSNCVNRIMDYNNGKDLKLYDIDLTFLRSFEAYQIGKGNSPNTVYLIKHN
ncbi:phage integrase SAM-like domain-containing protein [Flagellimonas sp. CMM7]|uniref:phage integrase SAM-like domain-containing protein n=1 Tax=Flagellimonas sp. CMM7 TaxID=2654676 RepID=UPI0039776240